MGVRQLSYRYRCKYTIEEVKKIHNFFNLVFDSNDGGFVRLFTSKDAVGINLTMSSLLDLDNLKRSLSYIGKEDAMYSLNLFKEFDKKTKKDIQAFRLVAVDLDYKESKYKKYSKENVIELLEMDYFNTIIPIPNFIEYGNNIRLIYVLDETVGCTSKSKNLVDKVYHAFANNLSELGGHKHTLTSYARIPYSTNTKTYDEICIINYSNYRYSLEELRDEWLNLVPPTYRTYIKSKKTKPKKKKGLSANKRGGVTYLFNEYSLNIARIKDLERIQEFYNFKLQHYKEYLCFLYRNHCILSGMSHEEAEDKTKSYYLRFADANEHKWRKIESQTRNVERKSYFIPNNLILHHLSISQEDEVELELLITISKEEKRRRDYTKRKESRRNEKGLTNREQQKLDLINKVQELKSKGMKQREVAEELGKGIATIKRYWNV